MEAIIFRPKHQLPEGEDFKSVVGFHGKEFNFVEMLYVEK